MFSTPQRRIDHLSPNSTPGWNLPWTLNFSSSVQKNSKLATTRGRGMDELYPNESIESPGLIERPLYLLETVPFKACTRPRRSPIFDPPPPPPLPASETALQGVARAEPQSRARHVPGITNYSPRTVIIS